MSPERDYPKAALRRWKELRSMNLLILNAEAELSDPELLNTAAEKRPEKKWEAIEQGLSRAIAKGREAVIADRNLNAVILASGRVMAVVRHNLDAANDDCVEVVRLAVPCLY